MKVKFKGKYKISSSIAWLATLILFCSFYILDGYSYGKYILFICTMVIGLVTVYQNSWKIRFKFEIYHCFLLLLISLCFMSSIWAIIPKYATEKAFTLLQLFICMSILYLYYSKEKGVNTLINIVMLSGYILSFYTIFFIGIDTMKYVLFVGERLGNTYANINSIGIIAATSIIIAFYKFIYVKKSMNLILILPSIFIISMSGSRKAFVLLIFGIIGLLVLKYAKENPIIFVVKISILGLIIIFALYYLMKLPIFDVINERMDGLISSFTGVGEIDSSTLKRNKMIQIGIEIFKEKPILGVGIGNAKEILYQNTGWDTYLHNNYIEIISSLGLLGFTLYYAIWGYVLIWIYKLKKFDDKSSILCIVLILSQFILDYGMVSYYSKTTFFYLMIYYLQLRNLKRKRNNYVN